MFIHIITYIVVVRYCLLLGTMMSSTYMPWAKTNHLPQFQDTGNTYVVRLLNMESWSNSLMIEWFCCYLLQQFRPRAHQKSIASHQPELERRPLHGPRYWWACLGWMSVPEPKMPSCLQTSMFIQVGISFRMFDRHILAHMVILLQM